VTSGRGQRLVAIPNIGDGFVAVFSDLVEVLITLVDEEMPDGVEPLPSVLSDGFGLEALDRIAVVLRPTQYRRGPRLLGTHGAEYQQISFVSVDVDDLETMGEAIRALGLAVLRGDRRVCDLLQIFAAASLPKSGRCTPEEIIAAFARLHGLLDLAWTEDAATLHHHLREIPRDATEVALHPDAERAYLDLAARLAGMWGTSWDGGCNRSGS
jgi:hypothetical protein